MDFGFLGSLLQVIPSAIGWAIAWIAIAVSSAALGVSSLMLQQSIDPSFIRVPYTTGGVIDVAWPIVRDFANMLLVLILIFIGLGTALRLGDYEAKKALPRLVGIALLINFAPVLMGFFVDATNIIMNFFLQGLLGGQVLASIGSNLSAIIGSNTEALGQLSFSFVAKLFAVAFFNMLTAIIFFFYATLFFVRKVVIWILVILSPIALIALILPATKGFFTKWWDQFIQWSTVGIFAAFFLWLGDHTIALAARGGFTAQLPQTGGGTIVLTGLGNILNEIMPFLIADMVLLIGFFMGLQSNAMGFNLIKSQSFGQQKWAAGKVGGALKRFKDERLMQSKPLQGLANKLATSKVLAPMWGEGMSGYKGAFARTGSWALRAMATPISGGVRKVGRALGPNIMDEQKQTIAKAAQESKKWDVPIIVSRLKDHSVSQADKVGLLHRLITEQDMGDAMKLGLTEEEIMQIRTSAKRRGEHQEIDVAFPNLLEKEVKMAAGLPSIPVGPMNPVDSSRFIDEYTKTFKSLFDHHPERASWITSGLFERNVTGQLARPEMMEALMRAFDKRQLQKFVDAHGEVGVNAVQDALETARIRAGNTTKEDWLNSIGKQGVVKYMKSNAGQEAGFVI